MKNSSEESKLKKDKDNRIIEFEKLQVGTKDWKTFSNWERAYKRKALKALTIDSAFAIFSDLWNAQSGFSAKEIELFRKKKLDELLKLRKTFDLIQKRMHA